MEDKLVLQQSFDLIKKDFGIGGEMDLSSQEMDLSSHRSAYKALEDFLTDQINSMLNTDLNALLNALYRIDLREDKVKELLHHSEPSEIARSVAKAVIEREKQKVITRLKYRP